MKKFLLLILIIFCLGCSDIITETKKNIISEPTPIIENNLLGMWELKTPCFFAIFLFGENNIGFRYTCDGAEKKFYDFEYYFTEETINITYNKNANYTYFYYIENDEFIMACSDEFIAKSIYKKINFTHDPWSNYEQR